MNNRCIRCGIADESVIHIETGSACHPDPIDCIQRLRAALPKTCDGVPIVPGMTVYTCHWTETKKDVIDKFNILLKHPTTWKNGEADEGWLFADRDKSETTRRNNRRDITADEMVAEIDREIINDLIDAHTALNESGDCIDITNLQLP